MDGWVSELVDGCTLRQTIEWVGGWVGGTYPMGLLASGVADGVEDTGESKSTTKRDMDLWAFGGLEAAPGNNQALFEWEGGWMEW